MSAGEYYGYRVMLVVQSLRVGGAENLVENLAYALRKKGCVVDVVALQQGETIVSKRLRKNGFNPVFIGKRRGFDPSVAKRLSGEMRRFAPDVVHSHLPILHYVNPAASRSDVANRVHTIHNVAQKETKSRAISAYAGHCYHRGLVLPVALSEINKQSVIDFYGISAGRVAVVPNGIDLSRFKPKRSYGISSVTHVCHIGRFQEAKNHRAIIEAARLLKRHHIKLVFDLYGEGPLLEEVRNRAMEFNVSDMIVLHGLTSDVPGSMFSSDIFILPSLWEGTPMVVAEAMAAGLPIIASRVGGIPDMINDGADGILCDPTGESLAECIERVLFDETLRKSLGQSAREASHRFSSSLMAERYIKVYMENSRG